ncbi:hypothetical protein APSETT445_000264 [Aspergillus pseudonomiae]
MAQPCAPATNKINLFSLDNVDFNPGLWFATFAVTRHLRYRTLINAYGMNNSDFQRMGQSCDDTIKLADSAAQLTSKSDDIFGKISTYKKNKETDHAQFYKENAENAIKAQQHRIQQAAVLFQTTSEGLGYALADIPELKPLTDYWCTWYQTEARKDIQNEGVKRLLDFQVTHDWVKVEHLDKSDEYLAQLHKSVLARWDGRKQDSKTAGNFQSVPADRPTAQNFKDTVFAYWNPRAQAALNGSYAERTANDNPGPK